MNIEFENKEVSDKFELAFGDKQKDVHVHVPGKYNGLLSGITLEAAEAYVEQGGNVLNRKAAGATSKDLQSVSKTTSAHSKQ